MPLIDYYPPAPGPVGDPGHYTAHDWAARAAHQLKAGSVDWQEGPAVTYPGGWLEPYPSGYATPKLWRMGQIVCLEGLTRTLKVTPGATFGVLQLDPDWCRFVGDYPDYADPIRLIATGNQGEDKAARFDVGESGRVDWYGAQLAAGSYAHFTAVWMVEPW